MRPEIEELLRTPPYLVVVSGRGDLQWMARQACQKGELERVLPGVYAVAGAVSLRTRAVALACRHPDAVIAGRAAAALSWWPELRAPILEAVTRHALAPCTGFAWRRGVVPAELLREGDHLRLTSAALTVLDLIPALGGRAIDEALRRGAVTLDSLWEAYALTPQRAGNAERCWLLHDSRDLPWSPAERSLHRLYRGMGAPYEYVTNLRVPLAQGWAILDLALPRLRLGFEVDGREHHTSPAAFLRDRTRDPELVELGWLVVRLAANSVEDDPAWVTDRMQGIIRQRAAELGHG